MLFRSDAFVQAVPSEYTGDRLLAWAVMSQAQRRMVTAEEIRQEVFGRYASRHTCYCSPSRGMLFQEQEPVGWNWPLIGASIATLAITISVLTFIILPLL